MIFKVKAFKTCEHSGLVKNRLKLIFIGSWYQKYYWSLSLIMRPVVTQWPYIQQMCCTHSWLFCLLRWISNSWIFPSKRNKLYIFSFHRSFIMYWVQNITSNVIKNKAWIKSIAVMNHFDYSLMTHSYVY